MPLQPAVLWAQRKTCIVLTIQVDDIKDPTVVIEKDRVVFKGTGGPDKKQYETTIVLNREINPEESKYMIRGRGCDIVLQKKEDDREEYWPRLLKDKTKAHWLKVDFNKWQDEDEVDEDAGAGPGANGGDFEEMMRQMGGLGGGMGGMPGMGMPGMGMGGMGGMGGLDDLEDPEEDSDDEALPDLEETTDKANATTA